MSVIVDGDKLFTKEMAHVFQTEVIECPDCGFEFSVIHEREGIKGCYQCPCCNEADLEIKNTRLNEKVERYEKTLKRISETVMSMGYSSVSDLANGLRIMAREAMKQEEIKC